MLFLAFIHMASDRRNNLAHKKEKKKRTEGRTILCSGVGLGNNLFISQNQNPSSLSDFRLALPN